MVLRIEASIFREWLSVFGLQRSASTTSYARNSPLKHLAFSFAFAFAGLAAGCFTTPTPAGGTAGASGGASGSGTAGAAGTVPGAGPQGCTLPAGTTPKMVPNGYYVVGATVCTADGTPHLFHGVDRPSLEFSPQGDHISQADFQVMASWNANVVRIALNQDYWLPNVPALYNEYYKETVQGAVEEAENAGLDVILDLHWSDRGDSDAGVAGGMTKQDTSGGSNQQQMADTNSLAFWTDVAGTFKDDPHVLFELYNEPNGIPWPIWLNGGMSTGFQVVGMQQLHDAIRAAGAENVVIAGGLDWAYDLSQVTSYLISGYNIMYATHPYDKPDDAMDGWDSHFGYLADNNIAPVIATEFGDASMNCTGVWDTSLIAYADTHKISWTAWGWYPGGCSFPSLISDWGWTPTVQGMVVQNALLSYPPPAPPPTPDAGTHTITVPIPVIDAGANEAGTGDATTDANDAGTLATPDAESIDATLGTDDGSSADAGDALADGA
jgi:endoglucanase